MITIMKKSIGIILMILIVVALAIVVDAAPPPPPNPPLGNGGPAPGETYIGGVPIAGGLLIMIALAASYGARKLYNARKRKISE